MMLSALMLSVDSLLDIEARPLSDGLGLMFFMLGSMSVPDNFGKKEKQP
jgi:hypothetical protein